MHKCWRVTRQIKCRKSGSKAIKSFSENKQLAAAINTFTTEQLLQNSALCFQNQEKGDVPESSKGGGFCPKTAFTNETGIPGESRTVGALSCYYSTESCGPDRSHDGGKESENKETSKIFLFS